MIYWEFSKFKGVTIYFRLWHIGSKRESNQPQLIAPSTVFIALLSEGHEIIKMDKMNTSKLQMSVVGNHLTYYAEEESQNSISVVSNGK